MPTTWGRLGAAAAALLLASALSGCGDSESSGATDDPSNPPTSATSSPTPSETTGSTEPTEPTEPPDAEVCPYLTAEQVSAAVGTPMGETAGSLHACFFDPEGSDRQGPTVMLSRVDVQIDPADYAAQTKALCQGEVTDVDLGDEAFACVMGLGPQGQLYAGQVLITVNVGGAADGATGIAMAAALLADVEIPPPA